jgi:hypothetical protein
MGAAKIPYLVRPESDFSGRVMDGTLMDNEDDKSEFAAWKHLEEELALHYEWQGRRSKLQWLKTMPMLDCGRV